MGQNSVIGLWVHCKKCSHKFQLGPLNAREIPSQSPFDVGWICWCDHCGDESTYQRADFSET